MIISDILAICPRFNYLAIDVRGADTSGCHEATGRQKYVLNVRVPTGIHRAGNLRRRGNDASASCF